MGDRAERDQRLDMFVARPESFTLIGYDTEDGPEHALWRDNIATDPPEELIASLDMQGNIEPVVVRKTRVKGSKAFRKEIVVGRDRVKAARIVNERRAARGRKDLLSLKYIIKIGEDKELAVAMVAENEQRRVDGPMNKARKMAHLINQGVPNAEICTAFGWTQNTLRTYRSLLELDPIIQKAIENGEIGSVAASKIAGLSREEQVEKFEALKSAGTLSTAEVTTAAQNAKATRASAGRETPAEQKYTPPGRRLLRKLIDGQKSKEIDLDTMQVQVLKWTMGEIATGSVPGLAAALRKLGVEP